MVVNGEGVGRTTQSGPDVRPLGFLAVGLGVLSILLAPTFFSPLAYLPAALALALGFIARTEEPSRKIGTVAVFLAVLAILCATVFVVSLF